jgi:fumarate reductase flavoprotein subunit
MTGTVLEEGLRGAGGWLLNGRGERFMERYDSRGERATRDIVSRAIQQEITEGRTTPMGGVYLQMSHLGADWVAQNFKGMVRRCRDCGFDLAGDKVEVVPTAHYMMGGVSFGPDGRTEIPGLFAAGEDTGGTHGANRLGGNGVANSTVFGGIAGESMADWVREISGFAAPDPTQVEAARQLCETPMDRPAGDLEAIREELFAIMWDKVGIVREETALVEAEADLAALDQRLEHTGLPTTDRAFNLTWHDWLNLKSLIRVSRAIAQAARLRRESRGAHYRGDYPDMGPHDPLHYTEVRAHGGGELHGAWQPVAFTRLRPQAPAKAKETTT